MMTRDRSTAFLALTILIAAAAVALPSRTEAQEPDAPAMFLALPETFPELDARAVLIREPGREIVVLKRDDSSPETLAMALRILRRIRTESLRPGQGQMVPMTGYALTRPLEGEERERLDAALGRLREQPLARVGNLGLGRSIPFWDPSR